LAPGRTGLRRRILRAALAPGPTGPPGRGAGVRLRSAEPVDTVGRGDRPPPPDHAPGRWIALAAAGGPGGRPQAAERKRGRAVSEQAPEPGAAGAQCSASQAGIPSPSWDAPARPPSRVSARAVPARRHARRPGRGGPATRGPHALERRGGPGVWLAGPAAAAPG